MTAKYTKASILQNICSHNKKKIKQKLKENL